MMVFGFEHKICFLLQQLQMANDKLQSEVNNARSEMEQATVDMNEMADDYSKLKVNDYKQENHSFPLYLCVQLKLVHTYQHTIPQVALKLESIFQVIDILKFSVCFLLYCINNVLKNSKFFPKMYFVVTECSGMYI